MSKPKFVEFIGNSWIGGKAVAAYRDDAGIRMRAETVGGKMISKTHHVSESEYQEMKSRWTAGSINHSDANVSANALRHFGIDV